MPDQLHEDLEAIKPHVRTALERIDELHGMFERDRWWRRVGKAMVVLAFVSSGFAVLILWTYDQHSRCVRGNQTRTDARAGIVAATSAYVDDDGLSSAERQSRVEAVEEAVTREIPLRDC